MKRWFPACGVFLAALGIHTGVSLALARRIGAPLAELAVYRDGHLYLEIAKSFPLPYSADGPAYLAHAPGFPALIHLASLVAPDWGIAALAVGWASAAGAAAVFYLVCREVGSAPLWPTAFFALANPRWVDVASNPYSEAPAVLWSLACLLALLRGRLVLSVAFLSLASLTRFPAILLGLPVAYHVLVTRGDRSARSVAWLAIPLCVLLLLHFYLVARVPGFGGLLRSHEGAWQTTWTWPFGALVHVGDFWRHRAILGAQLFWLTYPSLAVYGLAVVLGFRRKQRGLWLLPLWVAVVVVFHACLGTRIAAWDWTRFAVLAWAPTVLILWRAVGIPLRGRVLAPALVAASALSLAFARVNVAEVVRFQRGHQPFLEAARARLGSDEPVWVDFEAVRRERMRRSAGESAR